MDIIGKNKIVTSAMSNSKLFPPYRNKLSSNKLTGNGFNKLNIPANLSAARLGIVNSNIESSRVAISTETNVSDKKHPDPPAKPPDLEIRNLKNFESIDSIPTNIRAKTQIPEPKRNQSIYTPIAFWFEDPSAIFQTFDIIPNSNMTDAERLNAMTRVIIIISAIMFVIKFPAWWIFLVLGIIVVIILWFIMKSREQIYADNLRKHQYAREYLRKPRPARNPIVQPVIRPQQEQPRDINNQTLRLISIP